MAIQAVPIYFGLAATSQSLHRYCHDQRAFRRHRLVPACALLLINHNLRLELLSTLFIPALHPVPRFHDQISGSLILRH